MKRSLYFICAIGVILISTLFFIRQSCIKKPNILVILIDTLRADHLGSYGYTRNTSPSLDEFAHQNVLYKDAISSAPWTAPAVASLMTGFYPSSHQMNPPKNKEEAKKKGNVLNQSHVTIAELLEKNGYETVGFTTNPWITKIFGYDQGFQQFFYKKWANASSVVDNAIEIIEKHLKFRGEKPFFMYLHFIDPHDEYSPPSPFNSMFIDNPPGDFIEKAKNEINLYDGEIRFTDTELKRLFNYLKKNGLYDDLKIIVTADHGEQFYERGQLGHGKQLYMEEVHVPLIIKDGRRSIINYPTSIIDVFPTLLSWAHIKTDTPPVGVSLDNEEELKKRTSVFSETDREHFQRALTDVDTRLIAKFELKEAKGLKEELLFNRKQDSRELDPLKDEALRQSMKAELDLQIQSAESLKNTDAEKANVPKEVLDTLESLGYLN